VGLVGRWRVPLCRRKGMVELEDATMTMTKPDKREEAGDGEG